MFFPVSLSQAHGSDDKNKSEKGRKASAKPMKIIEEDDEDAFKGGSSDKVSPAYVRVLSVSVRPPLLPV